MGLRQPVNGAGRKTETEVKLGTRGVTMIRLGFPDLEIGRAVHAPSEAVWDLLTDTVRCTEWGPSVLAVECVGRYIRKGSRGRVRTALGITLPFLVTEWEDGRRWRWRVAGIRATGHRVEPRGRSSCLLLFEVPLFAAPYLVVCKVALDRIAALLND